MIALVTRILVCCLLIFPVKRANASAVDVLNKKIDAEQERIDRFDAHLDGGVSLPGIDQSLAATKVYMTKIDRLQEKIEQSPLMVARKSDMLQLVLEHLQGVNRGNYLFYAAADRIISFRLKTFKDDDAYLEASIMADQVSAAMSLPYFAHKPKAGDWLLHLSQNQAPVIMKYFRFVAYEPYASAVLRVLMRTDPMRFKDYLGTVSNLSTMAREQTDPVATTILRIYHQYNMQTRAYLLLEDVLNKGLSIEQAHEISSDPQKLLPALMNIRTLQDPAAWRSIEAELQTLSLRQVREVNELHNEPSASVRFASVSAYTPNELYTLMVYGESEIFTSTFLGMFDRMMFKLGSKSTYEFLYHLGFNRFRQWISMCAGYQKLDVFLAKMTPLEKSMLFGKLINGLEKERDMVRDAVAVADVYGSLSDDQDKALYRDKLKQYLRSLPQSERSARLLYELLEELVYQEDLGMEPDWMKAFRKMNRNTLFPDGKNVQQHFFYDDPDGYTSFATFCAKFNANGWKIRDSAHFVVIESTQGAQVSIWANKPKFELEGQKDILDHFARVERWPDVVVHRGHSYYARIAVETVTPANNMVFLGSCGGYHIIHEVLERSPNAAIISSKQIGTHAVNNALMWSICESLRKGEDLNWALLWQEASKQLSDKDKQFFNAYIRPDQNAGALFIQTYFSRLTDSE